MQSKIYVDTNIVVDICDKARPKFEESVALIEKFLEEGSKLYINTDTLSNLFYILGNHAKMSLEASLEKMDYINELFLLVTITESEVKTALSLCKNRGHTDYEDAMQYVCAKKIEADLILTNDKGFTSPDIKLRCTALKTYSSGGAVR
mgnify:CR=1 FL=1